MDIGIILLRAGSERIAGKNTKLIWGKPLCFWVLQAASRSHLDLVVASSDSLETLDLIKSFNLPKVVTHQTSAQNSRAESQNEHGMKEVIDWVKGDLPGYLKDESVIVNLQATSPYTRPIDINHAIIFARTRNRSVVSGTPLRRFVWDDGGPLNYDPALRPRTQEMYPLFMENGAVYACTLKHFNETGKRIDKLANRLWMPVWHQIELDTEEDWSALEQQLSPIDRWFKEVFAVKDDNQPAAGEGEND
jgi:N-acylneuraminate cytidylyltransferase